MLLLRLGQLAPPSVVLPRLDDIVEPLKVIMKDIEVKDDTVKQDLERKGELLSFVREAATNQRPLEKIGKADAVV